MEKVVNFTSGVIIKANNRISVSPSIAVEAEIADKSIFNADKPHGRESYIFYH